MASCCRRKILWIGGSSQLARTYCSTVGKEEQDNEKLCLSGYEPVCPFPLLADNVSYHPLDLARLEVELTKSIHAILAYGITTVIVSIRPVLMTAMTNEQSLVYNQRILDGLEILLTKVLATGSVRQVLHISSVAAIDHLKPQVDHREEDDPDDEAADLPEGTRNEVAPYDKFKRDTEHLIGKVCNRHNRQLAAGNGAVLYTNLRVSGLLFEEGRCIVGQSFELQARLGVYIPTKVDMNPARNVCAAIRLILQRMESQNAPLPLCYYYTRPTHVRKAIPLADITVKYIAVNAIPWYACLFIPFWIYEFFIYLLTLLAIVAGGVLPYVHATDYLLRVSLVEHTFNNSRFLRNFPDIARQEITVEQCFEYRRLHLQPRAISCKEA